MNVVRVEKKYFSGIRWTAILIMILQACLLYGQDFECLDCHDDFTEGSVHHGVVSCGSCHEDVVDEMHMEEGAAAVDCGLCHYDQSILSKSSMHFHLGEDGPSCLDCHDYHQVKYRSYSDSRISNLQIPGTCGECHGDVVEEYMQSIHWNSAKRGIKEAPVCNDCHIAHNYHPGADPNSLIDMRLFQEETCIRCHEDPVIQKKYYKLEGQTYSYQDSYHGLAVMRGDEKAAMCVDCHGVHKILPADNPESSVHTEQIVNTCSSCHQGATFTFAHSYTHRAHNEQAQLITYWVRTIYFWLIVVVIGGMLLHNLLITFSHLARERRIRKAEMIPIPRFTNNEVIQHWLLLTTFILLAITGFMLRMPESIWAKALTAVGINEFMRQWIHRVSAILMIITGAYHVYYLILTRRGRDVLISLFPRLIDVTTALQNIAYYLGLRKNKPEFDQYDYAEKAEYWALIWGTLVMGATGFVLWFPTLVGDWAPMWFIKVAEIIHYYEAILATLAIIVWHWFFVLFNPETKMSYAWLDGKVSLHDFEHHHMRRFKYILLEWMRLKKGRIDKVEMTPYTKLVFQTLEDHKYQPDEVFNRVLEEDPKLKEWVEMNLDR